MNTFEHERHKPPTELAAPFQLVVAVPEMQSNVNLSRIVRAAGCCGIRRVIAAGRGSMDPKIARDALEFVQVEVHRSLEPHLLRLKEEGYRLVGLEQATQSRSILEYSFPAKAVMVVGHERLGIEAKLLRILDDVVEIPIYGRPLSHNAATAAAIAMYEYCRQHAGQNVVAAVTPPPIP